jgi:hypothetical protein
MRQGHTALIFCFRSRVLCSAVLFCSTLIYSILCSVLYFFLLPPDYYLLFCPVMSLTILLLPHTGISEMKLGNIVQHIRSGNSYKDKRQELEEIGFKYKVRGKKD